MCAYVVECFCCFELFLSAFCPLAVFVVLVCFSVFSLLLLHLKNNVFVFVLLFVMCFVRYHRCCSCFDLCLVFLFVCLCVALCV